MPHENRCRICGGTLELLLRGDDPELDPARFAPADHSRGGHGDLLRCRECATVQQPALPDAAGLAALYAQMQDERYLDEEPGRRQAARTLLDLLCAHVPSGRLLDVGCGYGLFLDEARQRGFGVLGVEASVRCAEHARDELGLQVLNASFEDAALEPESFDAVVLTDVLEHLADPVATIRRCAALLAPGGALLITTPDPSSPVARLAGRRWWSYLVAHHCLLPRRTLRELLAAEGLVLAAEQRFARSFTLGYWLSGLLERAGNKAGPLGRIRGRTLALALGDDRTYLARRVEVRQPEHPRVTDRGQEQKVHVVIPAHNAERTIAAVARALPVAAIDRALVVDDASSDATVQAALDAGLEVLRHPVNRGYGANQKTCYVRAALDGADVVVMVHGDNQYDPALVAEMTRRIESGEADVVIGSRLLEDEAIAGGMPRWKWLGNRALTWVENRGFRASFSEYHTGYRAFSLEFLRTIPFLRNSDRFVFDQEIFAQLIARRARVVELAIPTRYFLEASSVSFSESVKYGLRTLVILARFRLEPRRRRWPLLRAPAAALDPLAPVREPSAQPMPGVAARASPG